MSEQNINTDCLWKYQSRPCGYVTPTHCCYCGSPVELCGEKCLAACKARHTPERFDGVLVLPENCR